MYSNSNNNKLESLFGCMLMLHTLSLCNYKAVQPLQLKYEVYCAQEPWFSSKN